MCEKFCGSGVQGFAMGNRTTAMFDLPLAAQRDPLNANGYYLADRASIRYFDQAKNEVTLFVGAEKSGSTDGVGADARFEVIRSLLVASHGRTLWCGQWHGFANVRRIDTADRRVTSLELPSVGSMCWDLARTVKPDSAFYCVVCSGGADYELARFDTGSGHLVRFPTKQFGVLAILVACTSRGHLILWDTRYTEWPGARICAFDPITCDVQRLEFFTLSNENFSMALIDSTQTLVTYERGGAVTTYTLPSQFFPLPKCCDRDL